MKTLIHRPRAARGFTLIEMMVTVVLLSILMALAFPAMSEWVRNSRIRTVADALQNGLRLAQTEALRRSRQTVFSLTADTNPADGLTAAVNGANWSVNFVPLLTGEETAATFIEGGGLTGLAPDVRITGPATLCFNSLGRVVDNPAPGTGVACSASAAAYNITIPNADRPMRVLVALGGQVRLCDPAKTLSNTNPDGCPA
ncbi:GspH/FimT family pseudopilin [Variovorax sp. OV700]|uniref:GspH/FimT family pseudopilin n=1 Tax=Variovorax sp. OV700 TaxID=1882826 RepID=UPI000889630B|nr:GspH/FimT family pseudopilin [Variovorax sp. OV700]SDJ04665.1 type IV fimbrial biogenesis protein FimT [Variovorax sp. OV700]